MAEGYRRLAIYHSSTAPYHRKSLCELVTGSTHPVNRISIFLLRHYLTMLQYATTVWFPRHTSDAMAVVKSKGLCKNNSCGVNASANLNTVLTDERISLRES